MATRRFAVGSYGPHAFEIIDGQRHQTVAVVGGHLNNADANRRATSGGRHGLGHDPAILAEARALADVLEAAAEAGTLPAILDRGREAPAAQPAEASR